MIQNEFFRVEITDSGAMELEDLRTSVIWRSAAPFVFNYGNVYSYNLAEHCEMQRVENDGKITVVFRHFDWFARFKGHFYRKPDPGPKLEFAFTIELRRDRIEFEIGKIANLDAEPVAVTFPAGLLRMDSRAKGEAVLPLGYGALFRFPRRDAFEQSYGYGWDYNAMPIYALLPEQSAGMEVFLRDVCDQRTSFSVNWHEKHTVRLETTFRFRSDTANYPRHFCYRPVPAGSNYVQFAKHYRELLQSEGRFVPLAEKIKQSPEVEKLVGAVIWKHSVYSQKTLPEHVHHDYSLYTVSPEDGEIEKMPGNWSAYELFQKAYDSGFDRLCVYNTGWNRFGFDSGYPTRLPPNPERGTPEEFRAAADFARTLSPDFIYSIHDNYYDVYDNSPEDFQSALSRNRDGGALTGGVWRSGRASLLCTSQSLKYAKRDIPKIVEMLGRGSMYTDVFGVTCLTECHHPDHPQSERDDLASRRAVMKYLRDSFGSLATEGATSDAYADLVDLGAYCSFFDPIALPASSALPLCVPLWQLVYHDSVLGYSARSAQLRVEDYYAMCALYGLLPGNLEKVSLTMSRELRGAYRAEMTSHEFLSPVKDGYKALARSRFADGTTVVANTTGRKLGGIPAHSFKIIREESK